MAGHGTSDFHAEMVAVYVDCAIWAGLDWSRCDRWTEHACSEECVANGNPPPLEENYCADDIAPEALEEIRQDCASFIAANRDDLAQWAADQAGHDFYLTRNGHGAGFWDRGLEAGDRLAEAARVYGTSELHPAADGTLGLSY